MKIHLPEGTKSIELVFEPTTGIDILRTRGTPIELIGSYLAAGDKKMAGATFRTSVLEYLYEKLITYEKCKVRFVHSELSKNIAFVCNVESGVVSEPILDHITATVMAVLECVSANLLCAINDQMSIIKHPQGTLHVDILVDLFEFELEYDGKAVAAHATAPVTLQWIGDN